MLRSRNHSSRISRHAAGEVHVNEMQKLKDDHSLAKCQHGAKKPLREGIFHTASKDAAEW